MKTQKDSHSDVTSAKNSKADATSKGGSISKDKKSPTKKTDEKSTSRSK